MGYLLRVNDEKDAENLLIGALPKSSHSAVIRKLKVASRMIKERPEEGLKLAEEVMSQAKQDGDLRMTFVAKREYIRAAHNLGRYEETVAMATECLESARACYSDSSDTLSIERKHTALCMFAISCGMTGRFDESKRAFDELIVSATRIFGRDHEETRRFSRNRALHFVQMVVKAKHLVFRGDLANCARYLDAVLIESKARDFFDAKDANVQIDCGTMVGAASVLKAIGRLQESMAVSRLCLESARARKDLDSEVNQICMWDYATASCALHGPTNESKQVLDELLAIQTRLHGPDATNTQTTASFILHISSNNINA